MKAKLFTYQNYCAVLFYDKFANLRYFDENYTCITEYSDCPEAINELWDQAQKFAEKNDIIIESY